MEVCGKESSFDSYFGDYIYDDDDGEQEVTYKDITTEC